MLPTLNYENKTIITSLELDFIDQKNRKNNLNFRNGMQNLGLYIPRVDARYTQQDIKHNLFELGIGTVSYVDFVGTRDLASTSNTVLFYSAFVTLEYWNTAHPRGQEAAMNAADNISTKIYLNNIEFWILLPAKDTIPRSKVNIHQLAKYTNELFTKVDRLETDALRKDAKIEELTQLLHHKCAVIDQKYNDILVMNESYNYLYEKFVTQSKIIDTLFESQSKINDILFQKVNTLSERLDPLPQPSVKDIIEENINPVAEPEVPVPAPDVKLAATIPYCEDECFFFAPLKKHNLEEKKNQPTSAPIVIPAKTEIATTKIRSISPENNIRAKNSFSFCGNE